MRVDSEEESRLEADNLERDDDDEDGDDVT